MFYEEKVIDGVLCSRSQPGGDWLPASPPHAAAVNALLALTDEQRLEALGHFCRSCGTDTPCCQCWNDE